MPDLEPKIKLLGAALAKLKEKTGITQTEQQPQVDLAGNDDLSTVEELITKVNERIEKLKAKTIPIVKIASALGMNTFFVLPKKEKKKKRKEKREKRKARKTGRRERNEQITN